MTPAHRPAALLAIGLLAPISGCSAILGISDIAPPAGVDGGAGGGGGGGGGSPIDAGEDASTRDAAAPDGPIGVGRDAGPCGGNLTSCNGACVDTSSDAHNCGACLHDCGVGATCSASRCQPVLLASNQNAPDGVVVDATFVYWTNSLGNGGSVMECVATGCADRPSTLVGNLTNAFSIAQDDTNIYFTTTDFGGAADICAKSGCFGSEHPLAQNQSGAAGIAVDSTNVYWADTGAGTIESCPIAGCNGTPTPLASGQAQPNQVAVTGGNVYWTNTGAGGQLMFCASSSCTPKPFGPAANGTYALATDSKNVYWSDETSALYECPLAGCPTTPLVLAQGAIGGPAGIASDGTDVYWTTQGPDAVVKCAVSGCGGVPTTLASGASVTLPAGIALDPTSIYWANSPSTGGSIMRLAK
jgi:stigma-specific protein Stig1